MRLAGDGRAVDRRESYRSARQQPSIASLDWNAALAHELDRAIVQGDGRWSRALMAVALDPSVHVPGLPAPPRPAGRARRAAPCALWIVELAVVILTMRRVAGLGWFWSSPAINVIARLWVTFLILSFNVATLNALTGWESLWFKASWGTLSTFLFAVAGLAVHPQVSDSGRADVLHGPFDGSFPRLEQPHLRRVVVAGAAGHGSGRAKHASEPAAGHNLNA